MTEELTIAHMAAAFFGGSTLALLAAVWILVRDNLRVAEELGDLKGKWKMFTAKPDIVVLGDNPEYQTSFTSVSCPSKPYFSSQPYAD